MNIQQSLVVFGCAALCGLALAQTPKTPTSVERLDALEKEVQALRALADTKVEATSQELALVRKELAETRALVLQLVAWSNVQAQGAAELALVLDDSEQKGFTFGINPDSRVALLAGWRGFAAGLQKDVPKAPVAADATAKGAKPPAPKNP